MIKEFFLKQILKSKLSALPEAERERVMALVMKNPEVFEKIAKKIQEKVKAGVPETHAAIIVMKEHKQELQNLLG